MPSGNISLLTLTVTASATVAAARFVTQDGAYPAAAAKGHGVTRSSGVSGDLIPVDVLGTAIVEAGGTVAKGAALELDATGRVVTKSAGVAVAQALEAGVVGGQIEVLLIPAA